MDNILKNISSKIVYFSRSILLKQKLRLPDGATSIYFEVWSRGLLTLLHLSLQLSEYVDIAKRGAGSNVLNLWSVVLLSGAGLLSGSTLLLASGILEGTAVAEDDALAVLVELDDLEGPCLTLNGL